MPQTEGLGYAPAGLGIAVLYHLAAQLRFAAAERLPSQDCRCCDSVRDALQQLFRALSRSAVAINAMPALRFAVQCHAVPVQDLSLFPNAKPLRCSATQCLGYAMLCHAPPERCVVTPRCAGAFQWIAMQTLPQPCLADPCRSAALPWGAGPCRRYAHQCRPVPCPSSAMQSAGEQCRCGHSGALHSRCTELRRLACAPRWPAGLCWPEPSPR